MATFNILGSCICRDLFGFQEQCDHQIIHFLQSTSPLTWFVFNKKPKNLITNEQLENIPKMSNFQKRCVMNDYNNTVLDYYSTSTDYFVVDLISLFNSNLGKETYEDGTEHYFTISKWFKTLYDNGLSVSFSSYPETVNRYELLKDDMLEKVIKSFIKWLTEEKGYKQDQIILIENKHVPYYTDGELLYFYEKNDPKIVINQHLDRAYKLFEENAPGCHVVKMPHNTHGDYFHPWSVYSLHFTKDYYDYLYQCVNLICKDPKRYRETADELREKAGLLFEKQIEEYTRNSFRQMLRNENLIKSFPTFESENKLLITPNTPFYSDKDTQNKAGTVTCFSTVINNSGSAVILNKGSHYFVKKQACYPGVVGNGKEISGWRTANASTVVILKNDSFIITHNRSDSDAQTQIIYPFSNTEQFIHKLITFSVEARVLEGDENLGGSIAIINADGYNKGKFFARKDFQNREWKRIILTKRLLKQDEFSGLTLCLRAVQKKGGNRTTVEFRNPRLEFGMLSVMNI